MKRAIVTGGCGFIGSHLAEKLINLGYKVIIIDNLSTGRIENISKFKNRLKFFKLDIKNKDKIDSLFKKLILFFIVRLLLILCLVFKNLKNIMNLM